MTLTTQTTLDDWRAEMRETYRHLSDAAFERKWDRELRRRFEDVQQPFSGFAESGGPERSRTGRG